MAETAERFLLREVLPNAERIENHDLALVVALLKRAGEAAIKDGAPDWSRIAPLFFTFPDKGYWRLGDHVAEAWSIGKKYKP